MQTKKFKNAPVLSIVQKLSVTIQTGSRAEIIAHLAQLRTMPLFAGPAWQANFAKLAAVFDTGAPGFSIFAEKGNVKLPFVAFSSLPGVTCPGAGECLNFCYSFRAHRYPAAYARQAQNAFFMRFFPETIRAAFSDIAAARPAGFDFRLYVDGDFANVGDVAFWMQTLKQNPGARAYGYSKSFAELIAYGRAHVWPKNYMLNLSSGHNANGQTLELARELPITRGEFRAVSIGRVVKGSEHGTAAVNAALRAAVPDVKIFPCPGTCGTCTGAGHACGLPQLKGRIIAIAVH